MATRNRLIGPEVDPRALREITCSLGTASLMQVACDENGRAVARIKVADIMNWREGADLLREALKNANGSCTLEFDDATSELLVAHGDVRYQQVHLAIAAGKFLGNIKDQFPTTVRPGDAKRVKSAQLRRELASDASVAARRARRAEVRERLYGKPSQQIA